MGNGTGHFRSVRRPQTPLTLLVLRLTVGLLLADHGAQKLFGWFGGSVFGEPPGGSRPWAGRRRAVLAGVLEFGGGLLFAVGLFSPLGSLMVAAMAKVHWPKLWAATGGIELPLVSLSVVIAVGLAGGPGLDSAYGTALPPGAFLVGGLAVIIGWLLALFTSTLAAVSDPGLDKDPDTGRPAALKP